MTISQRTQRVVVLSTSLPCCAFAAWGYCDEPATEALAELRVLATGHEWIMKPYCPKHMRAHEPKRKRARAARTPAARGTAGG